MTAYELITNTTTLSLVGLCSVLLLGYDLWKKLYFRRHGIPGPFPLPLIGNILDMSKGFTSELIAKKEKYGKVYGLTVGTFPSFIIQDLDMLKEIFISRFSAFPNHAEEPINEEPFDKGVNVTRDGHWKAVRNTLSPAFTGNKMKLMTPIINKCCDQLVEHFEEKRNTETSIQCKDLFGGYSMDVVASTFFGLEVDSQKNPDDPFVKYAKSAFDIGLWNVKLLLALFIPGMQKLYNLLGIKVLDVNMAKFFKGVITQAIDMRKKEGSTRKDMLQLLIDAHKLDHDEEGDNDGLLNGDIKEDTSSNAPSKTALTDEEIMANAVLFIVAAYETTAAALCMTSYLLATHKEEQEKLIQEIDKFTPRKEDLTYENLSKMEHLDCLIREALRFYPPVSITDRVNDKEDIVVKGITIPKGFAIFVPIYAIHHDPDVWDEPEEFRPERFSKENRSKIRALSWLPFGDGPRMCLGMRLALMEIKFALVRVLQEFQFETCSETEIPPILNTKTAFICPANGIKLQVVPRKKTD
ncbi:Cytochrome P450 3A11 [Holothuria leucospilota]|uniref:Cytochrome P450 3A11 n=1 Tax=Holothuria leucospilota TaxID=206669 RepID=A0A9Q0YEQ2_HOLLE|nr:Cytochrome P450 3A11 [Holothuria leucospilota]